MAVREGPWQSKNDSDFILRSLRKGRRVDGRRLDDMRLLRMVFSRAEGQASAEIQLGRTRVLTVATGEVVPPFPDRPTEGFLLFNVELSPMASSSFGERNPPAAVEIARVIEIGVRDSQALDTEALCIVGGEKVWQIRCDTHVLDHCGNLIDACTLATMAALRHFRRPEVTIDGSKVVIHHTDEKEPHPLALHHVPICVTFAIFEDTGDAALSSSNSSGGGSGGKKRWGDDSKASSSSMAQYVAVDPSEAEEEVMKGKITFALTAHKELCALHKNGGVAVTRGTIQSCAWLAASKVEEIHKLLDGALAGADAKAASERQRRLRGTASANTLPGTRSTPFVVAGTPMPVDAESLKVKHLDYDDLHVTTSIQEEGLRGGKEKRSKGLEMSDARNTDLFAKMAKAARMTEARIALDEAKLGGGSSGARLSSPPSMSLGNGGEAGNNREGGPSGNGAARNDDERRKGSGSPPEMKLEGVDGGKETEDAALDEFTRLAKEMQDSAKKAMAAGQGAYAADSMDIEEDEEEEETVTLEGEFKVSALRKSGVVTDHGVSSEKSASMGRGQGDAWGTVDDGVDDDLLTAVKKGKGRSRKDKGKANKSKKGRA